MRPPFTVPPGSLELRDFIDKIRREFKVPYPLADRRPYIGGKQLLCVSPYQGASHRTLTWPPRASRAAGQSHGSQVIVTVPDRHG